jgi:hypothetical protein
MCPREIAATTRRVPVERVTDTICPRCESDEVEGEHIETGENKAVQGMTCLSCNAGWTNVYDFVAVHFDRNKPAGPWIHPWGQGQS